MKKAILIFLMFMPIRSFSQAITDGLVSYWPFSGNSNDESVNNNNLTTAGNIALTTDRNGVENSAFYFDGIDDRLGLNTVISEVDIASPYTISIWFRASTLGFMKLFSHAPTADNVHNLGFKDGNISYSLYDGTKYAKSASFDDIINWHHFVAIHDGNKNLTAYLDGKLLEGTFYTGSPPGNTNIGEASGNNGARFNGVIDDIYVFSRALNELEVFQLYNENQSSNCEKIFCAENGVGIGTPIVPIGYEFAVNGKAIMEGVKVELSDTWPDFVFEKGYGLRTLEEVESYINENNHLPEIPSEAEVTGKGINLGEMDAKLLQKIEELTLYMIELNKQMKSHTDEIEHLKAENSELKKSLSILEEK